MARIDKDKVEGENPVLLKPIRLTNLGGKKDPCFGKHYDLSSEDCKICGDSENCSIVFAQKMGVKRKEIEEKNTFKDLEFLVDKRDVRNLVRKCKKKGKSKKEIITFMMEKFPITKEEARVAYKNYKPNK